MTRQQIMDEIHEGMSEGADAARIPSLTDDEMEKLTWRNAERFAGVTVE